MKIHKIAIATIFIASVLIAGCSSGNQAGSKGKGGNNQRAVPVEVKPAEYQDFGLTFSLSGRLEANQQVDVTSKLSGKITRIFVHVGDQVKAGQPIVQLEGDEVQIQLQRSQASLLSARAKYEDAKKGTLAENLIQSQNTLADLQNKYDAAKKELDRSEALYKEGAISQEEVEKARSQLVSASTSLENQKQKLELDKKGPTQSTIDAAAAQVMQAEADLALSKLNSSNLIVKAPIDGIIGSLPVTNGETVANNKVVAQIVDMSTMKVKTQVDENKIGFFHNGQSVNIQVPAVNLSTKGKITSVSPLADSNRTYPIEIEIPNPDGRAKVGMIVSVEAKGEQRKALVVPREAVIFKDQVNYVFTVENDQAKQTKVDVGESDGERIEILKGLKQGDFVVVKGQNMLVPDASVAIIDPNKPDRNPDNMQSANPNRQRSKKE